MARKLQLTGRRFGMLLVIGKEPVIKKGATFWLCLCECKNEKLIRGGALTAGCTTACGCQQNYNKVDLIGKTFGRLKVIDKMGIKNTNRTYLCECSCGEILEIVGSELTQGRSQSCGCLQKELMSERASLQVGALNAAWKGGITQPRLTKGYYKWREDILERDKNCCQICKDTKNLEVHHLWAVATYPDKIYEIDNGITLCEFHHTHFHSEYGSGNNTPSQFEEYRNKIKEESSSALPTP